MNETTKATVKTEAIKTYTDEIASAIKWNGQCPCCKLSAYFTKNGRRPAAIEKHLSRCVWFKDEIFKIAARIDLTPG